MTAKRHYYYVTMHEEAHQTLIWLADHGYDGGFYNVAELESDEDGKYVYRLTESQAWEFRDDVEGDPHAFLACCGSEELSQAFMKLENEIV